MTDASRFDKIRIGIASPQDIKDWSHGEVKKPETINYRTFKPERDGLFCDRIFGPVKDWECHCGRYKKVKFKGVICDRCGVEVTRAKVRRERMGHIELAAPVSHIWYLKGVPSPISLLLDISPRPLERVLYFASYIVTHVDRQAINDHLGDIRSAVTTECEDIDAQRDTAIAQSRADAAKELEENPEWEEKRKKDYDKRLNDRIKLEERDAEDRKEEMNASLTLLEAVVRQQLITEDQYRSLQRLAEVIRVKADIEISEMLRAGMGGSSIKELLLEVDLESLKRGLKKEIAQSQGPKRARSIKRLEVVDAFISSKSRPEWMVLDVVPVISPELRPMVQLDGGRFATSDLNDLYRRIINRNNRLKKITEIRAPESIINHEKRLLQEAVDALIDNGRRARPVTGSNNRPLKSLSDMLKGKEGRFRKNLLGKRVDYSGRSVIVVGPNLKLHQCGLPKEMALELFKPFVMKTLVEKRFTSNIKTAKRMIDRMKPEVWDALEEVISEHPVMLNRAPTLHRLGIQAFEPILVDGKAIQIHPLVCHAFNADFDGDQMAVHVPLSASAQAEARCLMLSIHNIFSPADGRPVVAPIQDIVLGSFYLTMKRGDWPADKPMRTFSSEEDALLAYRCTELDIHEPIRVRLPINNDTEERALREITVGRLIFNNILPRNMRYKDVPIDKKIMAKLVTECFEKNGHERTVILLDDLKELGFRYSTFAGITISMTDMDIPSKRDEIVAKTQKDVEDANKMYTRGRMTAGERKGEVLRLWTDAANKVGDAITNSIDDFNPISIITTSGARGSKRQITQLAGMRGLMSDPFGNLIEDLPIKSNFHEGLTVLEYFISTHGARKGLADTALRTADAGYLTRRLVDVAQDVIVRAVDCGTTKGVEVAAIREDGEIIENLGDRMRGRTALTDIKLKPKDKEPYVRAGEIITDAQAKVIDASGIQRVLLRSAVACELKLGICSKCYGQDLSWRKPVEVGTAVGVIAAQSIGEPGTQLTMRTFHTGGIAGQYLTGVANTARHTQDRLRALWSDVLEHKIIGTREAAAGDENTRRRYDRDLSEFLFADEEEGRQASKSRVRSVNAVVKVLEDQQRGLLRVVELFEARKPKGQAITTDYDGEVVDIDRKNLRYVLIAGRVQVKNPMSNKSLLNEEYGKELMGDVIDPATGEPIALKGVKLDEKLAKRIEEAQVTEILVRQSYLVPHRGDLRVEKGDVVRRGDRLTDGPRDPHKVLELEGPGFKDITAFDEPVYVPSDDKSGDHSWHGVTDYLAREIQLVYKSQGVDIADKHVEVIVRQMLRKRRIEKSNDTKFLPGQVVDRFEVDGENARVIKAGGEPAESQWILLGITEASLATDSFLSAASFQKTTRVLTEAAVRGKRDYLVGLKENVIIGRLVPAGTGLPEYRENDVADKEGEVIKASSSLFSTAHDDEDDMGLAAGLDMLHGVDDLDEIADLEADDELDLIETEEDLLGKEIDDSDLGDLDVAEIDGVLGEVLKAMASEEDTETEETAEAATPEETE